MKFELHVVAVEDIGNLARVTAQGQANRDGQYSSVQKWTFTVPLHVGKRYHIGRLIKASVKPR